MRTLELVVELLVFAREQGAEERPEMRSLLRAADHTVEQLREQRRRKGMRYKLRCVRCEVRRTDSLLCPSCWADAPQYVAAGFRQGSGLDGLRKAHERLMAWARKYSEQKEAA